MAFATRLPTLFRAIVVADAATGEQHQITNGLADAMYPVWDAGGKTLWFLASTDFGLRSGWLDMTNYPHETHYGLYVAMLAKGTASPLLPESDEEADKPGGDDDKSGKTSEGGKDKAKVDDKAATAPTVIDFEGLSSRVVAVPGVPEKQYGPLKAGSAGNVFLLEALPGAAPGAGGALHRYQLKERKLESFASNVAEFSLSADGKKLLYRAGAGGGPGGGGVAPTTAPKLFLVDAEKPAPKAGEGELKLELMAQIDARAEFKQIFDEGWRNQRDYFYVPNLHGVDWPLMKSTYGQFLPHVNHRADLNYLLDQMGGETAVGHSYVYGGAMPDVPVVVGGLLGADFVVEQGRYRIARIYDDEEWNPELRAPLAVPGLDVKVGDYLVAVNGEELRGTDNVHRLLDGTAGKQTVLSVNARPALEGARRITVIPVRTEQPLRARAWVEANRRTVDRLSGGKLAYVHVPNTGAVGYRSFNRYYFAQQDRQGVIVDERYNGGGSAADYMIEVMRREFDGYFNNVAGDRRPFTSPSAGIWGPKVMIVNEMAGSGGDYLPYLFRFHKLGPIVGTRTWGGLVHTADTPRFVDGGAMIAPRGGYFSRDMQWEVENEGTTPDIEVENWPKDVIAGRDPQLERAVAEAMRLLAANPVQRSDVEPKAPETGKRK